MLNKIVIIGVGLIGGSFALALRKAGLVRHIVGVGRSRGNMQRALDLGVIDEFADDFAVALKGADLVLLAMPVGQTGRIMAQISLHLESATIVTPNFDNCVKTIVIILSPSIQRLSDT